jgi:hypothetical protein
MKNCLEDHQLAHPIHMLILALTATVVIDGNVACSRSSVKRTGEIAKSTTKDVRSKCAALARTDFVAACNACPVCRGTGPEAPEVRSCAFCEGLSFPCVERNSNVCTIFLRCSDVVIVDLKTNIPIAAEPACI